MSLLVCMACGMGAWGPLLAWCVVSLLDDLAHTAMLGLQDQRLRAQTASLDASLALAAARETQAHLLLLRWYRGSRRWAAKPAGARPQASGPAEFWVLRFPAAAIRAVAANAL